MEGVLPKPEWLRVKALARPEFEKVRRTLNTYGLRTVCDHSHCPNICDCWSRGTATFLILGSICTRGCHFCAVDHGDPGGEWDRGEAARLAMGVAELELEHVVITSVTRDDLPDGGAEGYEMALKTIHALPNAPSVEVLVPDMGGVRGNIARVLNATPQVFAHNIEVVPRLQAMARDSMASFERSIDVLRTAKEISPAQITKSSLMLGLGETEDEVRNTLLALREADVDIITLGQYLRPNNAKMSVVRYVTPGEFDAWRTEAMDMGFGAVMSAPFVRSSYLAKEAYDSSRRGSKC